jgi:ABC-type multidrug transport system fused ATPase/permease subunit
MGNNPENLLELILRLWSHFNSRRKKQFGLLLGLMVIASFAEILSIGSVLPFLAVLIDPQQIFELHSAQPIIKALKLSNPAELLLPLTILFCICAILAASIRLLLLRSSLYLAAATGSDIGYDMYKKTLYQPYSVHISRNSSEVIDGISIKSTAIANGVVMPALYILSSCIMTGLIISTLLLIAPETTVIAFVIFGSIYLLVIKLTRKQLLIDSKNIAHESVQVIKSLQEGLGGIRDVLIDGTQSTFCRIYQKSDFLLRRSYASSSFISVSPRFAVEALGMLLIAVLAYVLAKQPSGVAKAIPILGALALAAQRLIPLMQQAYSAWSNLRQNQFTLKETLIFLDQVIPSNNSEKNLIPLNFTHNIKLENISFSYDGSENFILKDINLTIPKGGRIGFIGETGSGKSTLLDIVMGLLAPTRGFLKIDDVIIDSDNLHTWQKHISHVPQNIFLADGTIAENIAFGIPNERINLDRVRLAAEQAQIHSVIEKLPNGYQTLVGERGLRLSGGQRQRLGIARAIYKDADVIILDEATSALDGNVENEVMKTIYNLNSNITILIIAHRVTSLKQTDAIVKIENGILKDSYQYHTIANQEFLK